MIMNLRHWTREANLPSECCFFSPHLPSQFGARLVRLRSEPLLSWNRWQGKKTKKSVNYLARLSNDRVDKVNNCLFNLCYFSLVLCYRSEQVTHQCSGPSTQICPIQKMALASHLHGTQSGGSQTPGGSRQDMIRIVNKDTRPRVETLFMYFPLILKFHRDQKHKKWWN